MTTSLKNKLNKILKVVIIFLLFIIVAFADLDGYKTVFCLGFLIALSLMGENLFILNIAFALSVCLNFTTINFIIFSASGALIWDIIFLIYRFSKKKIIESLGYVYAVVSSLPIFFFNLPEFDNILQKFIAVFLNVLFIFVLNSGLKFALNKLENIPRSGMWITLAPVIVFGIGLANLNFIGAGFGIVFAVLFLFIISKIKSFETSLLISAALGLGFLCAGFGEAGLIIFILLSLIMHMLAAVNKYVSAVLTVIFTFCLGLYFSFYGNTNWLFYAVLTLCLILSCLLPLKKLEKKTISKTLNVEKMLLKKQVLSAAEVCAEFSKLFLSLDAKRVTDEEAAKTLTGEICAKLCETCENRIFCRRERNNDISDDFEKTIAKGILKGKITLMDISPFLTSVCKKVSVFISEANELIKKYQSFKVLETSAKEARVAGGEIVLGAAKSLYNLGVSLDKNIIELVNLKKNLKEDFLSRGLVIENINCIEKDGSLMVFIETSDDINERDILEIVSKNLRIKTEIVMREKQFKNTVLTIKPAPKLDLVFGVASCPKIGSSVSGDKHSEIKTDEGRYLLALSDGMGTGEKADKLSTSVLGLLENFYKAGFSADESANSINRVFSGISDKIGLNALDAVSIDLLGGTIDFIKLGSPASFIKRRSEILTLEGDNLPIGASGLFKAYAVKRTIEDGDIIILVTDGITDAFITGRSLEEFILGINSVNPQTIANEILNKVLEITRNAPKDDSTALVIRVFKRV